MSLRTRERSPLAGKAPDLKSRDAAVRYALDWLKAHPGRSTLDAAYVAACADQGAAWGHNGWPEFLQAVRAAVKEG